jgi:hypothetical protein
MMRRMPWGTLWAGTWQECAQAPQVTVAGQAVVDSGVGGSPPLSLILTAALRSAYGTRATPCRPMSRVRCSSRRCTRASSPFFYGGVHHLSG